ncbi:MAG: chemotaxis protein CheB [Pirellulales bacterium]
MAKKRPGNPSESSEQGTAGTEADQPTEVLDQRDQRIRPEKHFPVIGIGASAGGLAALRQFFANVPENSGVAFVVVVHLSPEHKSHLAELLQPHVKMPVEQVSKTLPLEANHVYVIPPGANLDTIDTHLRLSELEKRRQERAPIDHFLRTLAATHESSAIGVILTGTGSDGTLGMKEIKEKGGLTVVQNPGEAEYDGMPQSAIATGLIDLVLPLASIPEAVLRFVRTQPQIPHAEEDESMAEETRRLLQKIFAQLRARTGRDFSRYKRSTILRRIQRRMQLRQIEQFSRYLETVHDEPDEIRRLADDLLITVTSFFRDREVFEKLEKDVIPQLFEGKGPKDEIRVWSVGCATGEEAFSVAMLLLEEARRRDCPPRIQVFASDLHERSLRQAREGFYPGDVETDVSPERLKRFFVHEEGGYRIRNEVRELVVYAPHNLMGDPPFSRLDLATCRNLLIYIQRDVQRDIIELFHYALKPEGYLVLGTSEMIEAGDLFRVEDKKCCIYRKRNVPAPEPRLPVFPLERSRKAMQDGHADPQSAPMAFGALHQRIVEQYAPPSILISPDDKVVHLSEHAGRYLLTPGGEPTMNVYQLVRRELHLELRTALDVARSKHEPVTTQPVLVRFDGEARFVVMHVRPSVEPRPDEFAVVLFEGRPTAEVHGEEMHAAGPKKSSSLTNDQVTDHAQDLELELRQTRQRLQVIIEEYEAGQEEMRASNEEMQSTNEELRSMMEELETSKEELQSMNEELQTVNQENRHKVEELSQLSSDLQNLLAATDIATVFLDRELRILRFTPRAGELFSVRMTDRGRPLSDLTHRLGYGTLHEDAAQVLDNLIPIEREVEDDSGRCYLTRVMPYRSLEDHILGIVITLVDITSRKKAEEELAAAKEYAESIVETLHEPLLVLDRDLNVKSCNSAFYEHFQVSPLNTAGKKVYELGNGQWDIPALRKVLEDVLPTNEEFNEYEVTHEFDTIGRRVMLLNGRRLDSVQLILLGIRDITGRKLSEEALREREQQFRTLVEQVQDYAIFMLDPEGRGISWNEGVGRVLGFEEYEFIGMDVSAKIFTPEDVAAGVPQAEFDTAIEKGKANNDRWMRRKDGTLFWAAGITTALRDDGNLLGFMKVMRDQTEQKRLEDELRQVAAEMSDANRRKDEFLATLAHELRNPLAPIRTGLELIATDRENSAVFEETRAMMQRQTDQLVTLVNDLLDISRISRGAFKLRRSQVPLSDVVRNAVETSRPLIGEARHQLNVSLPEHTCILHVDPNRLAQILANLLNNAVKYTPPEGHISLCAEVTDADVLFTVRDSGYGIPQDELQHIFEMFGQIERPDQQFTGLGIGPTLAKQLVEMHGGEISVHSEGAGKGSEFSVRIPIGNGEPSPEPPAAAPVPDSPARKLRVLVVDDNRDAAKLLGTLVRRLGHEVRSATDGLQAIEVASEFRPHVVLMDLGMPKMNGYEAAQHIRLQHWGQEMTLVALTGWGQDEDRRRTQQAGFDHHLVKPAQIDALTAILAQHSGKTD